MRTAPYWIQGIAPYRLAIFPRPRGGDWLGDELASLKGAGIEILLSLLTAPEVKELELLHAPGECAARGLEFVSFPIPDRDIPDSYPGVARLLDGLAPKLRAGRGLGIHCRAGIGRSSIL